MMKWINAFLLSVVIGCTDNTSTNKVEENNSRKESQIAKETFEQFYDRFHKDDSFQLARVSFPLKGYNISGENYNPESKSDSDFYWTRNDWVIQHKPERGGDFKIKLSNLDSNNIEERVFIDHSGFEVIRRFSREDGKWYLVFYGNQDL